VERCAGFAPRLTGASAPEPPLELLDLVDDQILYTFLKRRGIEPGAVERRYGAAGHGPSMYLTDPDGNTVELKGPPDADQSENVPSAYYPGKRRRAAKSKGSKR